MTAILRIETIGRCVAYVGERRVDPSAEIVFAGLLLFGLERGRKRSRSDVAQMLWPQAPENVRRARLRWLLSKLRNLGVHLDANTTRIGIEASRVALDFDGLAELSFEEIGPVLPAFDPQFSRPYEFWLEQQREGISATVLRQLLPRLSVATRSGQWESVAAIAEAVRRIDPLSDEAVLALAEAQCRLGATSQGLQTLKRFVDGLDGGRPELQLRASLLEQRMRSTESSIPRSEPRFVGRHEQLQLIDSLLRATCAGNGGALMLTGPAGIGKTRLLDEGSLRASISGMQVIRVRCQRADSIRPLSGVVDLVPTLLELRGALGCDPQKLARLRRLTETKSDSSSTEPPPTASPEWLQSQVAEALSDLLDAVSEEAPILIQIDDVQWVETSLQWLWNSVVAWSASHRVAWVFAFRTSRKATPRLDVRQVAVAALEYAAAEVLLEDLLSRVENTSEIDRDAILARGAGSPLFLRELVRHTEAMRQSAELPTSLIGIMDETLSGLDSSALRILHVAAILGRYATLDRIDHVAQLPRSILVDALTELDDAGILTTDRSGHVQGHILWAEAASSRIPDSVERLLHRYAAERLNSELDANPSLSLLWETARHWENAGDIDRSRAEIVRVAEHLARSGFPQDAATAYQRVIKRVVDPREQLRLLRRRIKLLFDAGQLQDVVAEVERHESLALELDPSYDRHNELELTRFQALLDFTGNHKTLMDAALACTNDPLASVGHRLSAAKQCARVGEVMSPALLAEARQTASLLVPQTRKERWDRAVIELLFLNRLGECHAMLDLSNRLVAEYRDHPSSPELAYALMFSGKALWLSGRVTEAASPMTESIEILTRLGYARSCANNHCSLIEMSLDFAPESATRKRIQDMREMIATLEQCGARFLPALALSNYEAEFAVRSGRPVDALELVAPLEAILNSSGTTWRLRPLAIHLSACLQIGPTSLLGPIAAAMEPHFAQPDYWHDWPATVYAACLVRSDRNTEAAAFANRFISEIRREAYPPPAQLSELAAAHVAAATNDQGAALSAAP